VSIGEPGDIADGVDDLCVGHSLDSDGAASLFPAAIGPRGDLTALLTVAEFIGGR
jgi:hypothetical protein